MKRRFFSAVCAMILLLSLAVSASAAQIDKHIKGSISVTQAYKGKPVAGGSMSLYYVADLEEANGCLSFAYTDAFKGCTADLSGDLTSAAVARETVSTPGLGRPPGGGHGNPLQYSCLENPHGQRSLACYSPWARK